VARGADPFGALTPLIAALKRAPLPPLLLVSGDDDWMLTEAGRRLSAAFRESFRDGEVTSYAGSGDVREAVDDAATIALFATNRLVTLDATELFRAGKISAEDVDALLDEAEEAGLGREDAAEQRRALSRLARRAQGLASVAGLGSGSAEEVAKRLAGRVKRSGRAGDLAALLAFLPEGEERGEGGTERLLDYASRSAAGDNALLVTALSPDPEHGTLQALRGAPHARLFAPDEASRRERLRSLGLERALERRVPVDSEVFDTLTDRGRLEARPFLSELDKLIDAAPGKRVTAEAAAKLVLDERKEYGTDLVELVAARRFAPAVELLQRLLSGGEFTAFRPYGRDEAPGRKGPKGEAAFFPLLGLLAGEVRRMLALKGAIAEARGDQAFRRVDYRTFGDRVLPALRAPSTTSPRPSLEGHPFVLHKAYLAALEWSAPELVRALRDLDAIDRDVKTGVASGPELLTDFLLARAVPPVP